MDIIDSVAAVETTGEVMSLLRIVPFEAVLFLEVKVDATRKREPI
jgi:hypothetical protein